MRTNWKGQGRAQCENSHHNPPPSFEGELMETSSMEEVSLGPPRGGDPPPSFEGELMETIKYQLDIAYCITPHHLRLKEN